MVCAFGTDDGKQFTDRHFGDSRFFDIYEISEDSIHFMQRVANESEEERQHADPRKAGSIAGILKACGVQAVISRKFGPNIKRIRKRFVCVRIPEGELLQAGKILSSHMGIVRQAWDCGEERDVLGWDGEGLRESSR